MKTYILTASTLLLCLLSLSLSAQNTSIGFKGGISQVDLTELGGSEPTTGFRAGGFLTYSITREFGIGAELNFARKGTENRNQQTIQLDYLEVPILAQYFFGNSGFRPKLFAGPYVAYLLNAKRDDTELNNYEESDYGFVVGAGFHQRLGNRQWLNVDLRYNYGLAEVISGTDRQNRDLSLTVGISFPLGN